MARDHADQSTEQWSANFLRMKSRHTETSVVAPNGRGLLRLERGDS